MKKFEYNENDVCTNPNVYFKSGDYSQRYLIEVMTALGKHGWVYGVNYNYTNGGGGCGCWGNDKDAYMSEEEAGKAGLRCIRRQFAISCRDEKQSKKALAIIDEALKPRAKQLSLFNEI